MRDFSRTPEPSGKVQKKKGWSFVVQKHAASRLHYDFRLELDGVLKSWSVPKGPSYDTSDKRLAVQTEDHPVEYGGFEGIIPEGEYGGGTVLLWDRGTWQPIGDPRVGLEKGKLDFELEGERLEGRWTLVRLRAREEDRGRANWLLFKRSDEREVVTDPEITESQTTSVATGRAMDEIAEATGKARKVWRSNRAADAGAAPSAKARIRAAAKEGKKKKKKKAQKKSATPTPEHAPAAAPKKRERASEGEVDLPPRKWDVAPREAAYRGPSSRRAVKRDDGKREPVAGVGISNGGRVVDPGSGTTKLEIARYYEQVAPLFLEHATRRPLALVRCPEGSAGECFYQKHSHPGMSEYVHVDVDSRGEEILSVSDVRGVVALAQWGAIELHGWGSRLDSLEAPDWIVMDLDPAPDVGWSAVVDAAKAMHERLREIGLTSFVKTTGGKGLHVVVPLVRRHDWDLVKSFSHAIALDMVDTAPESFTANMAKRARHGKIFVDYLRNGRGSTAVLPYSARARDGLPVAMPLAWSELDRVDPKELTVPTVAARLAKRRRDPWAELRTTKQSITRKVLEALERARETGSV